MGEGQSSSEKLLEVDTVIVSLNVCLEWMAAWLKGLVLIKSITLCLVFEFQPRMSYSTF